MTFWTLIRRSLRFHARAHLGVLLGAAIGSAALIGALVMGDSVRESLTDMALRRLGRIHFALSTPDRLFQASLGPRVHGVWPPEPIYTAFKTPAYFDPYLGTPGSSALALPSVVARQDGTARANHVTVLGVDPWAWPILADWGRQSVGGQLGGPEGQRLGRDAVMKALPKRGKSPLMQWKAGETAFINETLARQLGARQGDDIILRVRKPTALGLDAAISPRNEDTVAVRLKVGGIVTPEMLGEFGLTAQADPAREPVLAPEPPGQQGWRSRPSQPVCRRSSPCGTAPERVGASAWPGGPLVMGACTDAACKPNRRDELLEPAQSFQPGSARCPHT